MQYANADESLELLTTDEVARILRRHPASVRSGRSRGTFPLQHVRVGKSVLYRKIDLQRLIQDSLTKAGD